MDHLQRLVNLGLIALAVSAACDTWLRGTLFTKYRARLQARGDLLSELTDCGFCLSHHLVFWCCLLTSGTFYGLDQFCWFAIECLACVKLVSLLGTYAPIDPEWSRYEFRDPTAAADVL